MLPCAYVIQIYELANSLQICSLSKSMSRNGTGRPIIVHQRNFIRVRSHTVLQNAEINENNWSVDKKKGYLTLWDLRKKKRLSQIFAAVTDTRCARTPQDSFYITTLCKRAKTMQFYTKQCVLHALRQQICYVWTNRLHLTVVPQIGKFEGKKSLSQQADTEHWKNYTCLN